MAFCGPAEIPGTVHRVNYYSINRVQWLPSGAILWLAWVVSMISTDRGQQIRAPGLHLLSSLFLLLIRALSQGVMLSIGSTVGPSCNRHTDSAILSLRKSLRSGELRFYSSCINTKPPVCDYLKQFCDSAGLSSAQPTLLGRRYRTIFRALTP